MVSKKRAPLRSRVKRMVTAGVQIAPRANDLPYNVEKVIAWFRRSVRETRAKLVVFPESITTGFHPNLPLDAFCVLLPPRIETLLAPVQKVCHEERAHYVLPTYERVRERHTIYNSAFLIDARGDVAGVYRKTHPFPFERLSAGAGRRRA